MDEQAMNGFWDTEVGWIPSDWQVVPLAEVVKEGKQTLDPSGFPAEEFEYYSIPAFQEHGHPVLERGRNIRSQKLLVEQGTVLFGKLNPRVTKIWEVKSDTGRRRLASTEFIPLVPVEGATTTEFLYFLAFSDYLLPKSHELVSGSTPSRQRVDTQAFLRLPVPLPPLPEQRRIAHVLSAIQRAIQAQDAVIAAARELKRSLMHRLFTYGPYAEPLPTRESEIGDVPMSWNVTNLGDVVTLQRGYDLPVQDRQPGTVPIVSSSGISGRHEIAKVVGPGVVTGRYGTIGAVYYIEQDFWPLNTTLFVREFNGNDPKYISYFLTTLNLQALNDKTSVPGINRNHAHALKVRVPPPDQQRAIASILMKCDAKIALEEKRNASLKALFKSMLHQLMTGQVRVPDAEIDHDPHL